MKIIINIKDDEVKLTLIKNRETVDEETWQDKKNLSQKLLVKIDKLLQKNNLSPSDIKKTCVKTKISDKFTTVRIAKTVAKTFNCRE